MAICILCCGIIPAAFFFEVIPFNLIMGGYWEGRCMQWDPVTGYRFLPGKIKCSKLYDFRSDVEIGKEGFRCQLPLDKPSKAPVRLIILGHSMPFSAGCAEPEALHSRISETLLSKHNIQNACYNLSLPASTLLMQFSVLKQHAPFLKPTHVFYWGQDTCTKEDNRQLVNTLKNNIIYGYHYRKISPVKKNSVLKHSRMAKYLSACALWDSILKISYFPRAFRDLKMLSTLSIADAAASNMHIHEEQKHTGLQNEKEDQKEYSVNDMQRYCASSGVSFLKFTHDYLDDKWQSLSYPTDGHLTPSGIKQVAENLAAKIAGTAQ